MEPAALHTPYVADNIEAIYKAGGTPRYGGCHGIVKELHRIVNEAIQAQQESGEVRDWRLYD
jgi:hypothetical protein